MLGLVSIAREAVPRKVCSKSVRSHNASNPELVVQLAEAWKRVAPDDGPLAFLKDATYS
jgi:hypothetical protein